MIFDKFKNIFGCNKYKITSTKNPRHYYFFKSIVDETEKFVYIYIYIKSGKVMN